ncbi:hypothetical protein J27TS7_24520 [Paenibacillus dendritiformis]|nr:hypothetical protein J27TS7_24520 [Paenibacillus dendritiformis]
MNGSEVGLTRTGRSNPDFQLKSNPFPTDNIQSIDLELKSIRKYKNPSRLRHHPIDPLK